MGEIAEMMLDGTLCAGCGVVMHGPGEESCGIPSFCSADCAGETSEQFARADKFTPGPWDISKNSNVICRHKRPELVAKFSHTTNEAHRAVNKANAKITSAAPDMIDALLVGRAYFNKMIKVMENPENHSMAHDELDVLFEEFLEKTEYALEKAGMA